jgi:hypothetical protein
MMGARLTGHALDRDWVRLGLSWVRRQNGWWVDFVSGSNHSADIDSFKADTGSQSDWFELGTAEQTLAADLGLKLPGALDCTLEYAEWREQ